MQAQIEKLLHENRIYHTLFNAASCVIVAIDTNGVMVEINDYAVSFLGYSKEKITQEPYFWAKFLLEDQRAGVLEVIEKAKKGEIVERYENAWISRSGEVRIFEWSNALVTEFNEQGVLRYIVGVGIDITESQKMRQQMRDYVALVDENIINSSTDLVGRITQVSQALCRISDYTKEELIGKTHAIIKHPDMPEALFKDLWETISRGDTWKGEMKNSTKKGDFFWVYATVHPIFDIQGKKVGYTAIRQDITDKKRVEELSVTDVLTKLYNRRKIIEILEYSLVSASRYGKTFSVMMLDIDYFKSVNDTYGHNVGDITLQTVSTLLRTHSRSVDVVGRWGGEEFVIVLPDTTCEEALLVAQKLRQSIEAYSFPIIEHKTASFGVSAWQKGDTIESLIARADDALYDAKNSGRNTVSFR